jgi:DNA-binding transcriptional LysR family regulator
MIAEKGWKGGGSSLLIDQGYVALPAVRQGSALMYVPDFMVAQSIREGALTTVLDDWAAAGPGLHMREH